jgi:hypothetical protein
MGNCLKMADKQRTLALLELGWSYRRIQRGIGSFRWFRDDNEGSSGVGKELYWNRVESNIRETSTNKSGFAVVC